MVGHLTVIGRAERADIPDLNVSGVPVKVDTGADACSIWAHATEIRDDKLHVVFFDKTSQFYTGKEHVFTSKEFTITRVANSFGHREIRYKVKLGIRINGRKIRGSFTLSERSSKLYPILIGRSLLRNKFVVDVSQGKPLVAEERKRAKKLRRDMNNLEKGGSL